MRISFAITERFNVDFGLLTEKSPTDIEVYQGLYRAKPDFEGLTLATKAKLMAADVTVEPIEVQRVSNTAGGRTVYIGGLING